MSNDEFSLESLKHMIQAYPDDAEAYYKLGLAYGNLKRYEEAAVAFEQAIRLDPDDVQARSV